MQFKRKFNYAIKLYILTFLEIFIDDFESVCIHECCHFNFSRPRSSLNLILKILGLVIFEIFFQCRVFCFVLRALLLNKNLLRFIWNLQLLKAHIIDNVSIKRMNYDLIIDLEYLLLPLKSFSLLLGKYMTKNYHYLSIASIVKYCDRYSIRIRKVSERPWKLLGD